MTGIHDYIVQVDGAYNETYTTEGGTELYLDRRFSHEKVANRYGTIINVPAKGETMLKKGYQILFDPSILIKPIYSIGGEQDSPNLVEKSKSWYKIKKELIVLYREDEDSEWKGFGDSALVERISEVEPVVKSSLIYLPESSQPKYKKGFVKMVKTNEELEEMDINSGDEVYVRLNKFDANAEPGLWFQFEGKSMYWVRTRDIVAKVENN